MISPGEVLGSVGILGGVATVFGTLISLANKRFWVWEDPRIDGVRELLPGADCGACGQAGCRAFAEAVISGSVTPAECTVMGEDERTDVAAYLGVDAGEVDRRVARLLCAGGRDVAPYKAAYHGIESCAAAAAVTGGGKSCPWGCLGYADCAVSCDFDAITMNAVGLPVVDVELCTACGDCVEACPLGLFEIMPLDTHLVVQCKNLLQGDAAEAVCSVACNACGRCVQDAEAGLITMVSGLATIDYEKIELENPKAVERCPTGAIVWLEGEQFSDLRSLAAGVGSEAA
ncbi:MAG: RnfABCDGE type electron transport complex subunit B [Gemmatimonadota bacterium]|nr:RnfABCDGE type electron transport complex subunit B [Gemmatimonadota bacterium]MDH5760802.1 RnfABCDGE type electron transport complex subunit B [Gemmatimonadota bacterium]